MMNNIKKKDSWGILYVRHILGNRWDSNRPTYLILTEILTITLLSTYRFVVF